MSTIEPHAEKLKYIFDNAKVGIAICNAEDNMLELVNPAFAHIHGYEPHELIGASPGDVFAPECMLRLEAHENAPSCAINDVAFETTHIRKDGTLVPVSVHITVIKDENGVIKQRIANIVDISKSKQVESELALREEEFRTLTENSPNIIMRYDLECRRIYVNQAFARHTGIPANEAVNTTPSEKWNMRMLSMSAEEYQAKIKHVIESGEQAKFVADWHRLSDGGFVAIDLQIVAQRDANDKIIGALAIGHDVTDRKQIEKQLLEQNRFLESLLNAIPVPIFLKDKETRYKGFNKAFEEFYGKNKEDLIGRGVFDIFPHDQAQVFFDADADLFRNGGTQIYEAQLQDARGVDHTVMFHKAIYSDEAGEAIGQIGTILDITERKLQEDRLHKTKAKLSAVISTIPDLIWVKDAEGVYMMCNPAFENFFGASCGEILGKTDYDFISREQADFFRQKDLEAMESGEMLINEEEIVFAHNGQKVLLETRKIPVYNGDKFMGILGIGRDITEHKHMESEINKQKDFQNTLLISIAEAGLGVHVIENGQYIYTNDIEKAKKYGYDETFTEVKPHFIETIHPDDRAKALDMYARRLRGEDVPSTYELGIVQTDGERREHSVSVIVIPNTDPIQTIVVTQDISEIKESERKIEHMAHHDALTGLPNRILAKIKAEQIMDRSKRSDSKAAFLFIDLDGFKAINDTLGHSVGDMMLKSVSSRLKACIRKIDTISRQGGDEFLLILSNIQETDVIASIAQKILTELEKSFEINFHTLSLSGSIGIALYPDHGDTFESLLQCSDTAMYRAKESGKNSYCLYTEEMHHNLLGEFQLQNDLKSAISNNEFVLHYQPQIDLALNCITGVEALIRWEHPQLGMIPPMNFIPLAESNGLIVQIGQWVLEEACTQAAIWHAKGIAITVAVNISAVQFKRGNLEAVVKNALKISGINPRFLELELTESILIHDAENILKTVRTLKELGIQLSIDDFGTGYSSLAYLKRFAVDKLKIDQSFVRDILQDQEDAAIVRTIIQIAKSLNLKTIAEGVEDASVLSVIGAYGCDEVQGYHFAKPLEASAFELFHANFRK